MFLIYIYSKNWWVNLRFVDKLYFPVKDTFTYIIVKFHLRCILTTHGLKQAIWFKSPWLEKITSNNALSIVKNVVNFISCGCKFSSLKLKSQKCKFTVKNVVGTKKQHLCCDRQPTISCWSSMQIHCKKCGGHQETAPLLR